MVSWTPYMLILGIPVIAAVAGAVRRDARRPDPVVIAGAGLVGIAFAILAATTHEPGVHLDDAVKGVVAAGLLMGALPVYLFFLLGRSLANHRVTLGVLCAAGTVPLAYFYVIGWILVLGLVHCPPDAYECPL